MSLNNPKEQLQNYINDVFIETGTYHGETAKIAYELGFKRVITIELQEHLQKIAKEKCCDTNIEFYLGDSPTILNNILNPIDKRITFWLDAHIDHCNIINNVTPNIRKCPLIEELNTIKNHHRNDHTIIIDDVRLFNVDGCWGEGILLSHIINLLKKINSNYTISYIDGVVSNDIIVANLI